MKAWRRGDKEQVNILVHLKVSPFRKAMMIDVIARAEEYIIIRLVQDAAQDIDEFEPFPGARLIQIKILPGEYMLPGDIEVPLLDKEI